MGRILTFLNANDPKKPEVFTSHPSFMYIISSVIITKAVDINLLSRDHRDESMHYFLKGDKKYL